MGRRKSGRLIHGVLILDKPQGISSNAALQQVRRLFNARKAGHTGALDPLATGMLPICLGEATKFSHFLLDADKSYRVTAKLGERTSTSDSEGEVIETSSIRPSDAEIVAALTPFVGEQTQSPSMFSALKHEGRPLYYYARKGIEVPRKIRTITIHDIRLVDIQRESNELLVTLDVDCSKGTYIRTLVDDLGQTLGCGAHVTLLHRHWVAGLEQQSVLTLEALQELVPEVPSEIDDDYQTLDTLLLPVDATIADYPLLTLDSAQAQRFLHGNSAVVNNVDTDCVRVHYNQQCIGVGKIANKQLHPTRVLVI